MEGGRALVSCQLARGDWRAYLRGELVPVMFVVGQDKAALEGACAGPQPHSDFTHCCSSLRALRHSHTHTTNQLADIPSGASAIKFTRNKCALFGNKPSFKKIFKNKLL